MTDEELIAGILNHDKPVIQFLVNKYHKQVVTTAYHFVHDMEDAEDLAQDVCLEILESIGQFHNTSSLSTWIYRLTVNKSLNFVRKNKRKQLVKQFETFFSRSGGNSSLSLSEPSSHVNPVDTSERKRVLDQAIDSLPENQKTAFFLSKYEELSYKEIAEIMNLSLASVESLLQRAKQNLQKKLVIYFAEYSKKK